MLRVALASLALVIAMPVGAVLIDGADGDANTAPFPFQVLDHVGTRGALSAVYLGNGVVLTAAHVGPGSVAFSGAVYPYVPGTEVRLQNQDGTYADLLMFEIYPRPDLPGVAIATARPTYSSLLLIAGNGFDRGSVLWWDPNGASAPGMTAGYHWDGTSHLRWGTNHVELDPGYRVFNTEAFGSEFTAGQLSPEAQAAVGDSGGAAFSQPDLLGWRLSGVILGISQYSGQPANTTFFGQRTYYADLAYYRDQLVDAVELPEPRGALAAGVAFLALLARKRGQTPFRQPLQELRARRCFTASRSVLSPPIG
jgi:hypothetical protein